MRSSTSILLAIVLVTPCAARADDYRKEMAAVDAASVVAIGAGLVITRATRDQSSDSVGVPFIEGGVVGFTFGAPLVHVLHDRSARGAASYALRSGALTIPMIVLLTGGVRCALREDKDGACAEDHLAKGIATMVVLAVVAGIVDYGVVARPSSDDDRAQRMISIGTTF